MLYSFAPETFSHKSLQCAKKNIMHVLKDSWSFHPYNHHFHKKFWQQLCTLHGLDNRSEGVWIVSRGTPARGCLSANSPGTVWSVVWPVDDPVQRTELLPALLGKRVMVPMEVLSVFKHVCTSFFAHWSDLCENFRIQTCAKQKMSRFLHMF